MAPKLPYFDFLLDELSRQNPAIEQSFGRHVHWGYWADPGAATTNAADYGRAAEALTQEICKIADIHEGHSVLDAGCGFGGTIASLNERFSRLHLVGLNIDERQLDRARTIVTPARDNRIEFRAGDACASSFGDEMFDRVLAVECVFHFPSRQQFFREANRVLKPDGILALSDFVPKPAVLPLTWLATSRLFEKFNVFGACNVQSTIARYRKLAAETGFVPLVERDVTPNILPTYDYLQQLGRDLAAGSGSAAMGDRLLRVTELRAIFKLLRYYLLAFRKARPGTA